MTSFTTANGPVIDIALLLNEWWKYLYLDLFSQIWTWCKSKHMFFVRSYAYFCGNIHAYVPYKNVKWLVLHHLREKINSLLFSLHYFSYHKTIKNEKKCQMSNSLLCTLPPQCSTQSSCSTLCHCAGLHYLDLDLHGGWVRDWDWDGDYDWDWEYNYNNN